MIIFILCNYVGCVDIIPIMLQNYYTGPILPPYYALECRLHVKGTKGRLQKKGKKWDFVPKGR